MMSQKVLCGCLALGCLALNAAEGDGDTTAATLPSTMAQSETTHWAPRAAVPIDDITADWVRLTNGEWLMGELIEVRDEQIVFDSDKFDQQTLDWADIAELHTASDVVIADVSRKTVSGKLSIINNQVVLRGEVLDREIRRDSILSIVPAERDWLLAWKGKLGLGLTIRDGNTNQTDLQISADITRRTPWNRLNGTYRGNYSEAQDQRTADNHRATAQWDRFLYHDVYLTPLSYEYYRDVFQNIYSRHTAKAGGGYAVVDRPALEWNLQGALGYQFTEYQSVPAGEDSTTGHGVFGVGTKLSVDLTSSTDFDLNYQVQKGFDNSLDLDHHLLAVLSVDITGDFELNLSYQWDHTGEPQVRLDGTTPQQDDTTFIAGVSYEF